MLVLSTAHGSERPEVQVSAPPKWVKSIPFSKTELKDKSDARGGEYYLLVDTQTNALSRVERFNHYAVKLFNENAVEENSRININFSPNYQSLIIHKVTLWRNGRAIDQPVRNKIKLLQREKELENLIYDGRWTATLLLEDVRKGDVLEYKYTIKGQNQAFKRHANELAYIQWEVPVARRTYRLLWPNDIPINITIPLNAKNIVRTTEYDRYKEYNIDVSDYPTLQVASETPSWYDPWERVIFSSVGSWRDVVDWGVPFYQVDTKLSAEIKTLVSKLRKTYPSKLEQASAALRYVQDEVRYVGIEVGVGGYIPTAANTTMKRRYGDCKDKTFLLLTILKSLNIEAYPVLANTEYGESLAEDGPRLTAFNHVLVKVLLGGKSYWLETTTNNQASTLDKIFQPDYGQALVLKQGNASISTMSHAEIAHGIVYDKVFDLTEGIDKRATLSITTTFTGRDAESFRRKLNAKGKKKLLKDYLDFYAKYYTSIESLGDVIIADDKKENQVTVQTKYNIPEFWYDDKNEKRNYAHFYAYSIYPYIKTPKIINRSSPYKYKYPVSIEQNISILLPEAWTIKGKEKKVETPFFKFNRKVEYDDDKYILKLKYKLDTQKKYIAIDQLDEYIKSVSALDDFTDYSIYSTYANNVSTDKSGSSKVIAAPLPWLTTTEILSMIAVLFLILTLYIFIEFRINHKKSPSERDYNYYPVATSKVFILSIISYGLYLVYWFYKNWLYVKRRDQSKIIPWGRAFFFTFWYYPLFDSFRRDEAFKQQEFTSLRKARYATLALLFFILAFIANIDHVYSYIALIIYVACMLPLVESINQLTPETDAYYKFNSKWRPRHFAVGLMFLPLTFFDVSTEINYFPSNTVVEGKSLWNKDLKYMRRIGVLTPDDELLLFYSDALFSFKEDGNGLSRRGVFSYWKDEETGDVNMETAKFKDIADIKYIPNDDAAGTIVIKRKNGSQFHLYAKNTKELNFYIILKQHWFINKIS